MRVRVFTLVAVAALAFALPASAQAPTGTVSGHRSKRAVEIVDHADIVAVDVNLRFARRFLFAATLHEQPLDSNWRSLSAASLAPFFAAATSKSRA